MLGCSVALANRDGDGQRCAHGRPTGGPGVRRGICCAVGALDASYGRRQHGCRIRCGALVEEAAAASIPIAVALAARGFVQPGLSCVAFEFVAAVVTRDPAQPLAFRRIASSEARGA